MTQAQHVAGQGRYGDSMLLHINPEELKGLAALSAANGAQLTINPETGLPEAFSLKDLLPSLLGLGLNFLIPGLGVGANALITGATTAALEGDLKKGFLSGLMSFAGGKALQAGLDSATTAATDAALDTAVGTANAVESGLIGATGIPDVASDVAAELGSEIGVAGTDIGLGGDLIVPPQASLVDTPAFAALPVDQTVPVVPKMNPVAMQPDLTDVALSKPTLPTSSVPETNVGFDMFQTTPAPTQMNYLTSQMDAIPGSANAYMETLRPTPETYSQEISQRFSDIKENPMEFLKGFSNQAMQRNTLLPFSYGAMGMQDINMMEQAERDAAAAKKEREKRRKFGFDMWNEASARGRGYAKGGITSLAKGGSTIIAKNVPGSIGPFDYDYDNFYKSGRGLGFNQSPYAGKYNPPPKHYMHGFMPVWDFFVNEFSYDDIGSGDGDSSDDQGGVYNPPTRGRGKNKIVAKQGGMIKNYNTGGETSSESGYPFSGMTAPSGIYYPGMNELAPYETFYPALRSTGNKSPYFSDFRNPGSVQRTGYGTTPMPSPTAPQPNPKLGLPEARIPPYEIGPVIKPMEPSIDGDVLEPSLPVVQPDPIRQPPSLDAIVQPNPVVLPPIDQKPNPPPVRREPLASRYKNKYGFAEGGIASLGQPEEMMPQMNPMMPPTDPMSPPMPQGMLGPMTEKMSKEELEMLRKKPEEAEIMEVVSAVLGENPNSEKVIEKFVKKYGSKYFELLRNLVLQSVVPNAQTQGLIQGQGTGMQDQVPGMIGNQQQVAVSPGEYIVPADVVSGLGDGSTDSGASKLDGMLDDVRMARGGNINQPPQINGDSLIPN